MESAPVRLDDVLRFHVQLAVVLQVAPPMTINESQATMTL